MAIKKDYITIEFIKEHYNDDLARLALNKNKYKNIDIKQVIREIISRKKLELKMPGWANNYDLIMPETASLEQSSSRLTAKFKANLADFSTSIDLSCGFGIDSYYIALKSKHHIAIEPSEELSSIVKYNFNQLELTNTDVFCSSAEYFLKRNNLIFDFVYIDPSRRTKTGSRKFLIEDYEPNIIEIFSELKRISHHLIIKLSPMLDIKSIINLFPEVNDVYVLSVNNECKELLLYFDFLTYQKVIQFHAVELNDNKFEYIFDNDEEPELNYGIPKKYIYDIHPVIMKTGFFDSYAMSLGLEKLSRNCHLYTSEHYLSSFTGKVYELENIESMNLKEFEKNHKDLKAVVIRKDFPLSVESIRKKYKIGEGENKTIFAVKLFNGKHAFIFSNKIR